MRILLIVILLLTIALTASCQGEPVQNLAINILPDVFDNRNGTVYIKTSISEFDADSADAITKDLMEKERSWRENNPKKRVVDSTPMMVVFLSSDRYITTSYLIRYIEP